MSCHCCPNAQHQSYLFSITDLVFRTFFHHILPGPGAPLSLPLVHTRPLHPGLRRSAAAASPSDASLE